MPDSPESQAPQVSPSQPYSPVAAPPPKSGSSALKIVLIIVGIFVGLGILAAGVVGYGIYKVAHAVHTTQSVSASDLGIAIYPGATQGKGSLHMTIAGKSMITANYLTSDSEDQVLAFYKNQAGPNAQVTTTAAGGVITVTNGSDSTSVSVMQNGNSNDGKTQITIIHTGSASN